jgi:branched-chain amino acid aminotransferase
LSGGTWLNGKLVTGNQQGISLRDRGLLFGDGLFETVRVYSGMPFAWPQHRKRLEAGCATLKIDCPLAEIERGMAALLQCVKKMQEGSLRITLTRGEAIRRGLLPAPGARPTLLITSQQGDPYPEHAYQQGFSAITVSFPRNHRSPLVRLKSLNSLELILGRMEAEAAGANEGIFLNLQGELCEGSVSNLFVVTDQGEIITPPVSCGLLPGIARALALDLASQQGFTAREEKISPSDLYSTSEAFLTNSLLEVMPLISLDGRAIGSGLPGPVVTRLRRIYREHVQAFISSNY